MFVKLALLYLDTFFPTYLADKINLNSACSLDSAHAFLFRWFGELPYWLQYWLSFFFIFTWFWADISRVCQMCTSNVMISNFAKFVWAVSLKLARTSEVHNIEIQSSYTHCHLISRLLALYGANKEEKLQVYKNTKLASIPMKPILCIWKTLTVKEEKMRLLFQSPSGILRYSFLSMGDVIVVVKY